MNDNNKNRNVIKALPGSKLEQVVASLILQRDENRKRVQEKYRKSKKLQKN
jgi:hypothetical protein